MGIQICFSIHLVKFDFRCIASSLYLPYLTLQMQQVGLNIEEIAIIYSVLPFVTCVMPPLAGSPLIIIKSLSK